MFAHEFPGEGFLDLEEADTPEVHDPHRWVKSWPCSVNQRMRKIRASLWKGL